MYISEHMNFPLIDIFFLHRAPNVDNTGLSDHLGINFELSTGENIRGVGYWKLNTSLLQDEIFWRELKTFIKNEIHTLEIDYPIYKWEHAKISINNFCGNY